MWRAVVVHLHVALIANARMIGLANSSMMSIHAMMIGRVVMSVVANLITVTVAIIVTVMMIKAIVMEAAIRGEDMMMIVPVDMMMIILVIIMMMMGMMVIGMDDVIASLLRMSTLPIKSATFLGIPLMIVGGAMVMILSVMIVETKMPTSLV
jgi:hypothetical protein